MQRGEDCLCPSISLSPHLSKVREHSGCLLMAGPDCGLPGCAPRQVLAWRQGWEGGALPALQVRLFPSSRLVLKINFFEKMGWLLQKMIGPALGWEEPHIWCGPCHPSLAQPMCGVGRLPQPNAPAPQMRPGCCPFLKTRGG